MTVKSKKKAGIVAPKAERRGAPPAPLDFDRAEVENVQYFLRALNQISLALSALGYLAEGEMLAQVKMDLHESLFGARELPLSLVEDLH